MEVGNIGFSMEIDNGKVSGQGVCSTFRGEIKSSALNINDFTIQDCSGNIELEIEYFAALSIANRISTQGNSAFLYLNNIVLAEFEKVIR